MIISDLNHLEVVNESAILGGIANRRAKTKLEFYETVDIEKFIFSVGLAVGNVAFAEADADAYGKDTLAQALSYTKTTPWSSSASATSVSVSN